jgi:hypothetical protein
MTNEETKPFHFQDQYNGPNDWHCVVYRRGVRYTSGRGRCQASAREAALLNVRGGMRCERASRALDRAGQSVHAQLAKLSALSITGV